MATVSRWKGIAVAGLIVALAWCVLLRTPLIVNARGHLDSDLAVDGLTLREAVEEGRWRWHYPGTLYMGTGAVLLSYLPARIGGTSPETLVVGGVIAYGLLAAGVFATAWAGFGPRVAAWSLVPMTFASTGTLWLTSRITGGHMLAAAWSAGAWVLLVWLIARGGTGRAVLLGLWCGLGLWHDSMFLMTLVGLFAGGPWAMIGNRDGWTWRSAGLGSLAMLVGFAVGVAPRPIGRAFDPYDAYGDQFAWSLDPALLKEHARILFLECLPRLVAGHRLPGLEADPDPMLLGTGGPMQRAGIRRPVIAPVALVTTILGLAAFVASIASLAATAFKSASAGGRAVAVGTLATSAALLAAFVVNRNIFNADNQRYLVLLLIPGALGFGLACDGLSRRSTRGLVAAMAIAAAYGGTFALDASAWYRRLGWIDERGSVVRRAVDDPALRWLGEHPEVAVFQAGYWEAYRLVFLSDRPLRGVPHPIFPNRFPEWSRDLPGGRPTLLIARPSPEDQRFLRQALEDGGKILLDERGTTIATWPIRSR